MRMPIEVPVVLPSNTPERIFTTSPSRRWLTNWDVPVRRRSTSAWRSDSLKARPGGQPSTMQPSAGPWLSPNVVTVNSLPMELPDIQLLSRQHEHSSASALEVEPGEWHLRVSTRQQPLGVAHLDHEQTERPQVSPGGAQDGRDGIESVAPGLESASRLVPVLARQPAHLPLADIGRIAHDDIVGTPRECREMIRLHELHAPC